MKTKQLPKVAFICNHNSCRSQMAEALGKHLCSDVFESFSAGTIIKSQINQDAVRLMKEIYNIDMEETQYNKKIDDIPNPDIVIFMGCNVECPILIAKCNDNWGLDDPSGKTDDEFKVIIKEIERRVLELKKVVGSI
ncbi:MAG: arsenate reductase ArsC [bacterium]